MYQIHFNYITKFKSMRVYKSKVSGKDSKLFSIYCLIFCALPSEHLVLVIRKLLWFINNHLTNLTINKLELNTLTQGVHQNYRQSINKTNIM